MIKFNLKGTASVAAAIRLYAKRFPSRLGDALHEEMKIEMEESKRRVPFDTGALRDSGRVSDPERVGNRTTVTLSYGGGEYPFDPIVPVVVHEDLEAFHKHGQAKYLSSVLDESAPYIAERVARRLREEE